MRVYQDDYLSKFIDFDDWGVSSEFFHFIDSLHGPFTVDRFANSKNTRLPRFNSLFWNPNSEAVDCFTQNWAKENNWLVPPIFLVIKTIKYLIQCKAKGTLIIPKWPSAAFWPMIFRGGLCYREYVKDVLEFKNGRDIYVHNQNKNCLFGSDCFNSAVLAVRLDASTE